MVDREKQKLDEEVWLAIKLLSVGTPALREELAGEVGFLPLKRDFTSSEASQHDTLAEHGEDEIVPMESEPTFILGEIGFSSPDQTIYAPVSITETESEESQLELLPGVALKEEIREVTFYGDSFGDNSFAGDVPFSPRATPLLRLLNEGIDVASVLAQASGYSSSQSEASVRSDVSQI